MTNKRTSQDYFLRKSTVDWESEAGKQAMRAEEYKAEAEQLREQNTMLDAEAAKDEALHRHVLYLIDAWERGCDHADYWCEIAALRERLK